MAIVFSGELPASMAEGSRAGDWAATLSLSGTTGQVAEIEAVGPGASYLSLRYDPVLAILTIAPGAELDYEAFAAAGRRPEIVFSLRYRQHDGVVRDDPAEYRIQVLDRDDTPPTALGFVSGGSVAAGAIGAAIGRLAITDPDSTGPFHFRFGAEDDWRFEVVDGTLKLRDGISLGLDDIGIRPVLIEVSDGRQSAAFPLDITVTAPGGAPFQPPVMAPGELRGVVALASEDRALVLRDSHALAGLRTEAGGEHRRISLQDGTDTLLPAVRRIEFADGFLDLDPLGLAARAAALHQALHGGAADGVALGGSLAALRRGASFTDLAADALAGSALAPAADDAAYVVALYHQALGREPDAAELALQAGRLASGTTRAQLATDIALGGEALTRLAGSRPEGLWVALPSGREVPDAAASHALAPQELPQSAPSDIAADLLLF